MAIQEVVQGADILKLLIVGGFSLSKCFGKSTELWILGVKFKATVLRSNNSASVYGSSFSLSQFTLVLFSEIL